MTASMRPSEPSERTQTKRLHMMKPATAVLFSRQENDEPKLGDVFAFLEKTNAGYVRLRKMLRTEEVL